MENEEMFVPQGAAPIEPSTGEIKEGYEHLEKEDPATEGEATPEATTEETTATTESSTEDQTGESPESNPESSTGEPAQTTEQPVATEDNANPEQETGESSLNTEDDNISVFDIMEDYNSNIKDGDARFEEIIARATRDIDALDPIDIIEEGMILASRGDITDNELDVEIEQYDKLFLSDAEKQEMIEDGEMTEREFQVLQAKFDRAVRENRDILKKDKESIDLKGLILETGSQPQASQQQPQEVSEEQMKAIKESFEEALSNYNNETLKVVDKEGSEIASYSYAIDDEAKQKALDVLTNPQGIFSMWVKEDGSFNQEKYISDVNFLLNRAGMLKTIYDQSAAAKTEEIVKDKNNIVDPARKPSGEGEQVRSLHDALLHNMGLGE
jgi:hypothetical protein